MINDDGSAMICDFGCARIEAASYSVAAPTSTLKGTCNYWAPELLSHNPDGDKPPNHSVKSDIWAFGMTVYVSDERYLRRSGASILPLNAGTDDERNSLQLSSPIRCSYGNSSRPVTRLSG